MLSTKSLGTADSGIASYYEHLSADDYYQAGSEPPGQWHGALSSALGLNGDVRPGQLKMLFEGYDPETGRQLASNAGEKHKAGWDLTFSAPKSVSVAWAFSDVEMQEQIAAAHDAAVRAGLNYLERNAFASRDREGEKSLQGIIAATYQHSTSREQDPQLHSHCAVANIGLRTDGTPCAIDFDSRWKMAAGAVYRAELAARLRDLGLDIERDAKSFCLTAIPEKLCKVFSKRRDQIVEHLQRTGFTSAKSADIAALATRRAKEIAERDILRSNWLREAGEAGYSLKDIQALLEPVPQQRTPTSPSLDIPAMISALTQNEATFTRQQLEAAIAVECQGFASAMEIPLLIQRAIDEGISSIEPHGLIQLEESGHAYDSRRRSVIYTTREMLQMEQEAITGAVNRKHERHHTAPLPEHLLEGLSSEQAQAVRHVVMNSGGVASVRGLAGTGKSFMLSRAREAWEQAGFNIVGAALAGKAADGLQQGSGIQSQTLHSLLAELDSGQRQLDDKSIVVVDEAGMVGTRQLHKILMHIHSAGAKAVLVGDPGQLQPIEAGGLFRRISKETGYASLEDIRRQESTEDRAMIKKLIGGEAMKVIEQLSEAGQLRVEKDDGVATAMVKDWLENRDSQKPGESLMLAGTRADVRKLNLIAREALKAEVRLHSEITISTESGEKEFCVGERVIFQRNSRALDVRNGQLGTLESWRIEPHTGSVELSVRMDDGEVRRFDPNQYGHLDHGYAISVHKSQGVTCDNVSVLMSETMSDREWSYVAMSRHRKRLRVFVQEGEGVELQRAIGKSRQKGLASDFVMHQHDRKAELAYE